MIAWAERSGQAPLVAGGHIRLAAACRGGRGVRAGVRDQVFWTDCRRVRI